MTAENGGGFHYGNINNSAVVHGNNNTVRNEVRAEAADDRHEQLLLSVGQLRDDLTRLVQTEETRELEDELTAAQGEIQRTGQAGPERTGRLAELLRNASTGIGALASGAAVVGALSDLGV